MQQDAARLQETAHVGAHMETHDAVRWRAHMRLDKYSDAWTPEQIQNGEAQPYETIEEDGNLLMYGGASVQWQTLLGNGTTTAGQALTYYNNANAAIGVGDSTTAEAATHTDLQAATNKLRKAMDATFPTHTDGVVVGSATITFKSTFATGEANWVWNEWAIFNSATAGTGRMLNRKVSNLGTKASGSWVLTITLTLA